ncbi:MAG TPA: hypothetical protein VIV06_11875 [Candidatus Limnocylindrales bacterium]
MSRFRLEGKKVVEAYYEVRFSLNRQVEGEYGTTELGAGSARIPFGSEHPGGAIVAKQLENIVTAFEALYGPVMGVAPEITAEAKVGEERDEPIRIGQAPSDLPF